MTTQQKFAAAVNVIRNLPKNGPFQPSTDMKLKFYAYFKQASEGPNSLRKPGIWDIQARVKWGAWKELGSMTQEEAMEKYIEELKSIVETMSYNANVETFLSSLGAFYDCVPAADVDLVLGPVIEKVKSRVHSPIASRDTSPGRVSPDESKKVVNIQPESANCPQTSDSEDDEYCDVLEAADDLEERDITPEPSSESSSSSESYDMDYSPNRADPPDVAISHLHSEINRITCRVRDLETALVCNILRQAKERKEANARRKFLDVPLSAWGIFILWPLCAGYCSAITGINYQGPFFEQELKAVVEFLDNAGLALACLAKGSPDPTVVWYSVDGDTVTNVSQLQDENANLAFPDFGAESYRQDDLIPYYRCKVNNAAGRIFSRANSLQAEIKKGFVMEIHDSFVLKGFAPCIRCVPPAAKPWVLDGTYNIHPLSNMPLTGKVTIYSVEHSDSFAPYRCMTVHQNPDGTYGRTKGRVVLIGKI